MLIHRAYKTELDPTYKQVREFLRHAGVARFAYNWGLRTKIEAYKETGKSPSAYDLCNEMVKLKNLPADQGGLPWLGEVSKHVRCEALADLDKAFQGFFRNCKKGAKEKGYPKFKSKKHSVKKFKLRAIPWVRKKSIKLPRIGEVRLKQHGYLPTSGVKINSATVSEHCGRWYVSLNEYNLRNDFNDLCLLVGQYRPRIVSRIA